MSPPPTLTSTLSFAEIKELISYAREQKVLLLEAHGVRFQFSPVAHDPPPQLGREDDNGDAESPYGRFKPA